MQVPHSTAASGPSQPLSGSSLSAAHQLAVPDSAPYTDGEQPFHAEANSCLDYAPDLCPNGRFCIPASRSLDESASLQQLQHSELGCFQDNRPASGVHAECPGTAMSEALQSNMSGPQAEPPSDVPAAAVQHTRTAEHEQHLDLPDAAGRLDAQNTEHIAGLRLQSVSGVNAEAVTQQCTHECCEASVSENPEQHQCLVSSPLSSSSESQQSSAQLDVAASAAGENQWGDHGGPADVLGDLPTNVWDDRPSSSGVESEACSGVNARCVRADCVDLSSLLYEHTVQQCEVFLASMLAAK